MVLVQTRYGDRSIIISILYGPWPVAISCFMFPPQSVSRPRLWRELQRKTIQVVYDFLHCYRVLRPHVPVPAGAIFLVVMELVPLALVVVLVPVLLYVVRDLLANGDRRLHPSLQSVSTQSLFACLKSYDYKYCLLTVREKHCQLAEKIHLSEPSLSSV